MSKGTTIKEALAAFEEKNQTKACECEKVLLYAQIPSIEKMDASLSTLTCCKQLSLSTNQIEKIANLNGLKNLRILSLGRNNIKSLTGLEAVGETLQELWISYNQLEKLRGINVLKKLTTLFMSNNKVSDLNEFNKLTELQCLENLVFTGNPLVANLDADYRAIASTKLKKLKQLDGLPVIRQEEQQQQEEV